MATSKTERAVGATGRHQAARPIQSRPIGKRAARRGDRSSPPCVASDNADDDVHEHPTEWPDEVSLEPRIPHPGSDPVEVSTEPKPEHPERDVRNVRAMARSPRAAGRSPKRPSR